jgi:hypothetical protein
VVVHVLAHIVQVVVLAACRTFACSKT